MDQEIFNQVKPVVDAFRARSRMRVIAFYEQSGMDRDSKAIFEAFVSGEREVFYTRPLSSRECCLIPIYDSIGESKLRSYKHILPYRHANHIQFEHERFPFLVAREVDEEKWSHAKCARDALLSNRVYKEVCVIWGSSVLLLKDRKNTTTLQSIQKE